MPVLRLIPAVPDSAENLTLRAPFSFDMSQPDPKGMVLIDACVPAAMALAFLNMLQEYFE